MTNGNLPTPTEKPSLRQWLQSFLPFQIPHIPLIQTARNLDIALARLLAAGSKNLAARLDRSTKSIEAKSFAEQKAVEAVGTLAANQISSGGSLAERAIEYAYRESILKQENREKIAKEATEDLGRNPPREDASSEIDTDWLNHFARHAENISSSDLQSLWARILAGEIRKPGSSSLRTLEFLSTISAVDANRIVSAFALVVDASWIPRFVDSKEYIKFPDLLFLQEVGIIAGSFGLGGPRVTLSSSAKDAYRSGLRYFKKLALLKAANKDLKINIEVHPLTHVGLELFSIADTKNPDYAFFQTFVLSLSLNKASMKLVSPIFWETSPKEYAFETRAISLRRANYSGKLSCFFRGRSACLVRSIAKARAIRRRVSCGSITSSI